MRTPTQQIFIKAQDKYGMTNARVHDTLIRLAQDNARLRVESSTFSDLTDNTGGSYVPGSAVETLTVPTAFIHVSGSDLAPKAGFDTALGKICSLEASLADVINKVVATVMGKRAMSWLSGTVSTTLAAQDQTLTGVDGSGTNAVDGVTGRDRLLKAAKNQNTIIFHLNRIASAIGHKQLTFGYDGGIYSDGVLQSPASTAAGVDGAATATASLSDTVVDAFLTALTKNYGRIASHLNEMIGQTVADLTDSSGGTASDTIAALAVLPTYTIVSTGGASKADLDTQLGVIENNMTDLAQRINVLRRRQGFSEIAIATAGTPDLTLAAQTVSVTGVDGTGSNAAAFAGSAAIFTSLRNNLATLTSYTNEIIAQWGLVPLTNSSGGTVGVTLENIPSSGAGVAGPAGALAKVDVDAALVVIRNATASIAAKLAAITGAGAVSRPMGVIVVD